MIKSIIKDMDLDPCAEQLTEDLGALGLFDLVRVCFSYPLLCFMLASLADGCFLFLGVGVHEGVSRQECRLERANWSFAQA